MTKVINIRLDDDLIKDLELICKWEKNDRSSLIRRLLDYGIEKTKLDHSIRLYSEEKVSIGRAAEIAGVDLWTFHDELIRLGISHPTDESDLASDLKVIRNQKLTNGKK